MARSIEAGPPRKREFFLALNPVPAARPRVSRWGTYYPKTYKQWRAAAEKALAGTMNGEAPFEGPLYFMSTFYVERPKTTKRLWPRGDNDNFLKAIQDALTVAGWWHDDDQIVDSYERKRFAEPGMEPGIMFTVMEMDDFQ